jgi:Tol biopolymer transport system component
MNRKKLLISLVVVSLLVSMALPIAVAKKPPKPPGGEDPPADPAIAYYFQTSGPNPNRIMVMNDDGSNQAVIYEEYFNCHALSWSPDGTSLAWSGYTYVPNVPGWDYGIWCIDVDVVDGEPQGSNLQRLVITEHFLVGAAWSPSGDEIAFGVWPSGPGQDEIWIVPSDGGPTDSIYISPEGCTNINSPTWNSAGTHIAFKEVEMSSGDRYIKVIERATGVTTHTLLKGQFDIGWVDWARQGSDTLAFHGDSWIYTVDIDSGTATPVIEGGTPSWSTDNTKVVFRQPGKKPKLSTYEFSNGDITVLTNGGAIPDWRR